MLACNARLFEKDMFHAIGNSLIYLQLQVLMNCCMRNLWLIRGQGLLLELVSCRLHKECSLRQAESHAPRQMMCSRHVICAEVRAVSVQALRQTLLKKYARIRTEMDNLHNKRMSPYEKIEALESIRCQIQASWRTDEIRRQKPTPQVCIAG